MNIAIIGAGNVGGTLGMKWADAGHPVWFGVRTTSDEKYAALHSIGQVVSISEALQACEVVLLSLPGAAVADFCAAYGPDLSGKTVIDATNNFRGQDINNLGVLQEKAPGAVLVRAFSTLGWENFADPILGGMRVDLFYCAQPAAQVTAETLITAVGLRPILLGDLDSAPVLDGLTRVWFALVRTQGHGRRVALRMMVD